MFFIILVNILYSLLCPIGKIALNYSTPLFLTAFRMIVAAVILLTYQYVYQRNKFFISRDQIFSLVLASFFSIYLANVLEFVGLDYLTPTKTAFLYNLYPFASALLSYLFVDEILTKRKWFGLLIGFLGSLPLLLADSAQEANLHKYFGFLSLPEIAILVAVFACPLGWILTQKAICEEKCDSVMAVGITSLVGGLFALGHSYYSDIWNPLPVSNYGYFALTSLGLIIISNIISSIIYVELLKTYTLTFLSFSGFIAPLLTALFDWIIFGYTVSYAFYISTGIMFVGFYLFYMDELGKNKSDAQDTQETDVVETSKS